MHFLWLLKLKSCQAAVACNQCSQP